MPQSSEVLLVGPDRSIAESGAHSRALRRRRLDPAIGIGTRVLWFDEGYSAELARQPRGTWWSLLLEQEGGALLHAALLKPWLAVSDADGWLRFLSVPFAIGQVVVPFLLARRVIGSGAWAAAGGLRGAGRAVSAGRRNGCWSR